MEEKPNVDSWLELLDQLMMRRIDFVIVGGAAMALHGLPRATLDLDIYLPSTRSAITELFQALVEQTGLVTGQMSILGLLDKCDLLYGQWITFSIPNGPDLIDVFLENPDNYGLLKSNANAIELREKQVRIASIEQLRVMKQDCGRPIDLADVALLDELVKNIEN